MVLCADMAQMTPSEATLFLTDQCNFRCAGCKRQIEDSIQHPLMTVDTVERLLAVYPAIKGVCVAGLGEPTLCPQFVDIVNCLSMSRVFVGIVTNGSDAKKILALKHKPGYVSISLYGHDRDSYMNTVGIDVFDSVVGNFIELRKSLSSLGFSYYVNKKNYQQLPEIIRISRELGADFLNVTNYLVYDINDTNELNKVITTNDTDIIDYIDRILSKSELSGSRPVYVDTEKYIFRCPSYRKLINVNGAGEIGACQRQIMPSAEYGNIFDAKDWYNDGRILDCRNLIMSGQYPHENCKYCFGKMGSSRSDQLNIGIYILFHEKVSQTIECINSFLQYGMPIHVLNNGSSESSTTELLDYVKAFENVHLLQAPRNLGVGVGRNYLIENTKEEWLFFIDNDITIQSEGFIEIITNVIQSNSDVEAYIPRLYNVHESSYVNHLEMFVDNDQIGFKGAPGEFTNYFPGGASIVKRSVFQRCGLYDEGMFIGLEDMELALRAIVMGSPIKCKFVDEIILYHNHKVVGNLDDKRAIVMRYNIAVQEQSYKRILQKYPDLKFDHAYKPWVVEQQTKMTQSGDVDLQVLTPLANYGAGTLPRDNVELLGLTIDAKLLSEVHGWIATMAEVKTNVHVVGCARNDLVLSGITASVNYHEFCLGRQIDKTYSQDLRSYRDLEGFENLLVTTSKNFILAAVVLERLHDPRPFLRTVRNSLLAGGKCVLIVDLLDMPGAVPTTATYWRQWTLSEVAAFLKASGFVCRFAPAGVASGYASIELKAEAAEYELFLETLYLPSPSIDYLVVSQEHSSAALTGGIGTYVGELEKVIPGKSLGIVLIGSGEMLPDTFICKQQKYIYPSLILGEATPQLRREDAVRQTLDVIIYLYCNLKVIEFQDVNGKGYQFIQAKRAGFYPTNLMTQVVCHASRVSLEKTHNIWIDPSDRELYEEKCVIEQADLAKYPTNYIKQYYGSVGYNLVANSIRVERLPFTYSIGQSPDKSYVDVDTLIFFGKRNYYKGFKLFTDIVRKFVERCSQIRRVMLIGPRCDEMEECNRFFEEISATGITVEEYSLGRKDAVDLIAANADRSICIIPYLADNHPYSVLEVVDSFCPIVATTTGGIPELFPPQFARDILCRPDAEQLVCCLERWLQRTPGERATFTGNLHEAVIREQDAINAGLYDSVMNWYSNWRERTSKKNVAFTDAGVTSLVIVAHNNKGLSEFLPIMRHQYHAPDRVIFLVRSSSSREEIEEVFNKAAAYNYEVLLTDKEHDGEVLNEGLLRIDSPYVAVFHTTIQMANTCIGTYVRQMQSNPSYAYVTSYACLRRDPGASDHSCDDILNYLGEGILISQAINHLGHPYGLYHTESLRQCDGFVAADDVARGGWATVMRLASKGYEIGVAPHPEVIVSAGNTGYGSEYLQQHCLAVETRGLGRFESFRLQSLVRWLDMLRDKNYRLTEDNYRLKTESQMPTVKNVFRKSVKYLKKKIKNNMVIN